MNIKHYKHNWWNIDIHEYQNTTSITDEILIYMNIKYYKYSWWNIDIHEYQNTCLIFMYINVLSVILVVFDIHVYQCFISYTCSVLIFMYINVSPVTSITDETLIYMNIKYYMYNWWNIDIHEYQTLQV
jgi:hypothetical protein